MSQTQKKISELALQDTYNKIYDYFWDANIHGPMDILWRMPNQYVISDVPERNEDAYRAVTCMDEFLILLSETLKKTRI